MMIGANSDDDLRDFLKMADRDININTLDPGSRAADRELSKTAQEVRQNYNRAAKEMQDKLQTYLEKFQADDEDMKAQLDAGEITQEDYKQWRQNKMMGQEWYQHMRDTLATDATNSDSIAKNIVQGHRAGVYAENFNYGTYQIENGAQINTSFTLYNKDTVERLQRKDAKILPDPSGRSAQRKDKAWNTRHIQNEVLQGILQGESIPKIAKRMQNVETMNNKAAVRYARTSITSAQNAGRIDSIGRAQKMGIQCQPQWAAILDDRTRDSHRQLDGEKRNPETGKFSNGCRYPGDPEGAGAEIWNCRCTLITAISGHEIDLTDINNRNADHMTQASYEEWKNAKKQDKK